MPAEDHNPSDSSLLTQCLNGAPSWIYLIGGLAILASSLLVPAWLELDVIRARRDRLEQTLAACEAQVQAYRMVSDGLERRDTPLVNRLVARGLRSAPTSHVMAIPVAAPLEHEHQPFAGNNFNATNGYRPEAPALDGLDPVLASAALSVSLDPTNGQLYDQYGDSYLVRLAAGRHRMGLVIVGGIFVFVGLWRNTPARSTEAGEQKPRLLVDRLRLVAEQSEAKPTRVPRGGRTSQATRSVRSSQSGRRSRR